VVANLEKVAPELLCKLEKIFSPGFFLSMQHLIVHLPYEAHMGGGHAGSLVLSNREMSEGRLQNM
jgi:hypothetical protein